MVTSVIIVTKLPFLDAMLKLLRIPYLRINYISKSKRICNVLMNLFILISYFALQINIRIAITPSNVP